MIQKLKILPLKNMCDDVNILSPVIYFCIILKLAYKVYNWIFAETLDLIYIGSARDFFLDKVIFFPWDAPQVTR